MMPPIPRRFRFPAASTTLLVALSTIVGAVAVVAVVLAILFGAKVSRTQARLSGVVDQIQVERERNIRANCVSQNARHDDTIAALDALIERVPPARRRRALEGRAGTILLINALAPRRNCAQLVREQAQSTQP